MQDESNRRSAPRLTLSYPMRIARDQASGGGVLATTVTRNVSAQGAYFSTFEGKDYRIGQRLDLSISVPHRPAGGAKDVMLELRGPAKIVRIDGPRTHRMFAENGLCLTGVALRFEDPLNFRYGWA